MYKVFSSKTREDGYQLLSFYDPIATPKGVLESYMPTATRLKPAVPIDGFFNQGISNMEIFGIELPDTDSTEVEQDEGTTVKAKLPSAVQAIDSGAATPLEDKFGRHLWIRTRMCFCPSTSETDCRFHSTSEKGWEQCPHLEAAQKNPKMRGHWLWARNPLYGKPPTEEELAEIQAAEAAKESAEVAA